MRQKREDEVARLEAEKERMREELEAKITKAQYEKELAIRGLKADRDAKLAEAAATENDSSDNNDNEERGDNA